MRIPKHTCCFCRKLVLGIGAQDTFLDPYNLLDDPIDEEASEEGIVGHAHAQCLAQSPWADFWQNRLFQNYTRVRSFNEVSSAKSMIAFSDRGREFVVVRPGTIFRFNLPASLDGFVITYQDYACWDLREYDSLARHLQAELKAEGVVPINSFLEKFHQEIRQRIYQPAEGTILPCDDDPKETFNGLSKSVFWGEIRCNVYLNDEEREVVRSFGRRNIEM